MPKTLLFLQENWIIGMLSGFASSLLAFWGKISPFVQILGAILGISIAITTLYLNICKTSKEKAEKRVFEQQEKFLKSCMEKDKDKKE